MLEGKRSMSILRTFKHFLMGFRYRDSTSKPYWAFFLISGLCIGMFLVTHVLSGIVFFRSMLTGLLFGFLIAAGFACLFLTDSARQSMLLHERDRRIVELESELSEVRKKLSLDL